MAIDVAARAQRLQALQAATKAWANSQTTYYQGQVKLLKAILTGRTGSDSLPATAVSATSALVVNSIDQFLVGD